MSWDYRLESSALRNLRDLGPSVRADIFAYLDLRVRGATDPRQFGRPLRGDLKGYWRYRVRDYRVLCRFEDNILIVVVIAVGHRASIYEDCFFSGSHADFSITGSFAQKLFLALHRRAALPLAPT